MTAEECIARITKVLSRDVTIADGSYFQMDGRSTNIIYPGGKESLGRLFEIGNIIKEYHKKGESK